MSGSVAFLNTSLTGSEASTFKTMQRKSQLLITNGASTTSMSTRTPSDSFAKKFTNNLSSTMEKTPTINQKLPGSLNLSISDLQSSFNDPSQSSEQLPQMSKLARTDLTK